MTYPVMMFAAGFGTRMGALTAEHPKPMIPVAGRPLIDHALALAEAYGAAKIVANLHYKPDAIVTHLKGRGVTFSHETPDILETGGGLRQALPLLGTDTVITMNTDAVFSGPNPLTILTQAWEPDRMDALLLCIPQNQAEGHQGTGDFVIAPDGKAQRGDGLIFTGIQILKTNGLYDIPEQSFSLNLLWDEMLESGRLHACDYSGTWCDVGHPEGIGIAENMLGSSDV